jgi:hypothetical protein
MDENHFVLGARGWVWRCRAETRPKVCWTKSKFQLKVIAFGGIAKDYESAPIFAESGTVNAELCVDDSLDRLESFPI